MPDISKQFKALAHKHRVAIFEYLRQHELACAGCDERCNVGDIAQQFDLAPSTISHHLKVLSEAGLINCEQQGQYIYCTINQQTVKEMLVFFSPEQ